MFSNFKCGIYINRGWIDCENLYICYIMIMCIYIYWLWNCQDFRNISLFLFCYTLLIFKINATLIRGIDCITQCQYQYCNHRNSIKTDYIKLIYIFPGHYCYLTIHVYVDWITVDDDTGELLWYSYYYYYYSLLRGILFYICVCIIWYTHTQTHTHILLICIICIRENLWRECEINFNVPISASLNTLEIVSNLNQLTRIINIRF